MEKICTTCKKTFEQNQHPEVTRLGTVLGRTTENERCYWCALMYVSGGFGPEGGDFNSARFISGEMSDEELEWFQEDQRDLLRRYPEESDEERYPERYECQYCGFPHRRCCCYNYEPDPEDLVCDEPYSHLCAACGVEIEDHETLCKTCDTYYETSYCVCCNAIVPNDDVVCAECDEYYARRRLEYVLEFRILSGYWWKDLRNFFKDDSMYWLKRLRR